LSTLDLQRAVFPRELTPGQAHVWYVGQDQIEDPGIRSAAESLLTPDERARCRRLRRSVSRHQFLATRALVRQALSLYTDVPPEAWRFEEGEEGKPEIAGPDAVGELRFNLSHTSGMVVCGVTLGRDIGVDVEDSRRRARTGELADRFFSAREVEALRALPESQRRGAFFRYWTLKESYLKARGIGLSIPLDRFSFQLEPGSAIGIRFDPPLCEEDRSRDWSFWQQSLSDRHVVAAAVRTSDGAEGSSRLEVHCRQFSLRSESPNFTAR